MVRMNEVIVTARRERAKQLMIKTISNLAQIWKYLPVVVISLAVAAVLLQLAPLSLGLGTGYVVFTTIVSVATAIVIVSLVLAVFARDRGVFKGASAFLRSEALGVGEAQVSAIPSVEDLKSAYHRQLELVTQYFRNKGFADVSIGQSLEGRNTLHEPDLILTIGGKKYIREIKPRLLVPSDVENLQMLIEDISPVNRDIAGGFLITSTTPTSHVLGLADMLGIEIEILPQLQATVYG